MSKIKVKAFQPQLIVTVKSPSREGFNQELCRVLGNSYTRNILRLTEVSGKTATFMAAADMKVGDMLRAGIERDTFFMLIAQLVNVYRWLIFQRMPIANLVLKPEYVFVNSRTRELFLIYVPADGCEDIGDLKELLECFISQSMFAATVDQRFKQDLLNLLNTNPNIYTKTLEQYILRYCPQAEKFIVKGNQIGNPRISDSKSEYLRQMNAGESSDLKPNNAQQQNPPLGELYFKSGPNVNCGGPSYGAAMDTGTVVLNNDSDGTVLLDSGEGTVVLGDYTPPPPSYPKLIRRKTGEEATINKPVFHIGKEEGIADFLITGNPTVSRSHADIISRDGKYYLCDNNSTNRSYVNNILIEPRTNVEIFDGAKIRLSDEEFEFRIINY